MTSSARTHHIACDVDEGPEFWLFIGVAREVNDERWLRHCVLWQDLHEATISEVRCCKPVEHMSDAVTAHAET
jgi:hypothetical protein